MYVGVIRGDLPNSISLEDVETTSQANFTVDPPGQVRRLSRPSLTGVGNALAGISPSVRSTVDIGFPLVITPLTQTLRVRLAASGAYTVVTIAAAAYPDMGSLLAAVNAAFISAGISVQADTSIAMDPDLRLVLRGTGVQGPGTTIAVDSVANGSTANTALGLGAGASSFTVPTAAATILALLPVGGPLDVSSATVVSLLGYGIFADQEVAVVSQIAAKIHDTNVSYQSLRSGNLSLCLSANFNPDPTRVPAMATGPAITVVDDGGVNPFTLGLPTITTAVLNTPNPGDLTITGTDLGDEEQDLVVVRLLGTGSRSLYQKTIRTTNSGGTQGTVSATSVVIPASLIPGVQVATSSVWVRFDTYASNTISVT